jgi:hypothetical protein
MLWREIGARQLDDGLDAASWLARSLKCGRYIASIGPVNFLDAEAKNWPEMSVPNADAYWLMRIITADSACIAILKIPFVRPNL